MLSQWNIKKTRLSRAIEITMIVLMDPKQVQGSAMTKATDHKVDVNIPICRYGCTDIMPSPVHC